MKTCTEINSKKHVCQYESGGPNVIYGVLIPTGSLIFDDQFNPITFEQSFYHINENIIEVC